ncbi:MAG: hypothetical protein JWQ63_552 [Mucilaginibacter sp.]|nr:hypothetical protein [Mucilaginibacter sp.]
MHLVSIVDTIMQDNHVTKLKELLIVLQEIKSLNQQYEEKKAVFNNMLTDLKKIRPIKVPTIVNYISKRLFGCWKITVPNSNI